MFVKKKNGMMLMCVDFQELNNKNSIDDNCLKYFFS